MAFLALEDWCPIHASDAVPGKIYHCYECHRPVRLKKLRKKHSHFYHLQTSPSCRLYSKSEDHLTAQLYLQKFLPAGQTKLEHPLLGPLRVADVLWETQKIVFEIQCSDLAPSEAAQRIHDYGVHGYQIVWLLDDRMFNRRRLKGAESFLRTHPCYFAKLRTSKGIPFFYDQFEVFFDSFRIKKGRPTNVFLNQPLFLKDQLFIEKRFPSQIEARTKEVALYFPGDFVHKAVRSYSNPSVAFSLNHLRAVEILSLKDAKRHKSWWRRWAISGLGTLGAIYQDIFEWLWRKFN